MPRSGPGGVYGIPLAVGSSTAIRQYSDNFTPIGDGNTHHGDNFIPHGDRVPGNPCHGNDIIWFGNSYRAHGEGFRLTFLNLATTQFLWTPSFPQKWRMPQSNFSL